MMSVTDFFAKFEKYANFCILTSFRNPVLRGVFLFLRSVWCRVCTARKGCKEMTRFIFVLLGISAVCWSAIVNAEEQNLKFHFVTIDLSNTTLEVPHTEDHSLNLNKAVGVAVFEDGRIALKEYIAVGEGTSEGFGGRGYSAYTFQNGDSLNFRFVFAGSGGDYELISGTGAYEGATGTGRFDYVENKWENADEWAGEFNLSVTGN